MLVNCYAEDIDTENEAQWALYACDGFSSFSVFRGLIMSANAYMHGQDLNGNWVPMRLDTAGGGSGAAGGIKLLPWSYVAAAGGITNTSDVTLVAAAGAGKSNYLSSIQLHNKSGTATEQPVFNFAVIKAVAA